jgi:hypothetical protein
LFPDTIAIWLGAPAAAVAVIVRLSIPEAEAVSVCEPALVPRVHAPTVAMPAVLLTAVPPSTVPPPFAVNVTEAPANGCPVLPTTLTLGLGDTAIPTTPVTGEVDVGTIATARSSGSVPSPPEHPMAAAATKTPGKRRNRFIGAPE